MRVTEAERDRIWRMRMKALSQGKIHAWVEELRRWRDRLDRIDAIDAPLLRDQMTALGKDAGNLFADLRDAARRYGDMIENDFGLHDPGPEVQSAEPEKYTGRLLRFTDAEGVSPGIPLALGKVYREVVGKTGDKYVRIIADNGLAKELFAYRFEEVAAPEPAPFAVGQPVWIKYPNALPVPAEVVAIPDDGSEFWKVRHTREAFTTYAPTFRLSARGEEGES
jgi:hypothetical protein